MALALKHVLDDGSSYQTPVNGLDNPMTGDSVRDWTPSSTITGPVIVFGAHPTTDARLLKVHVRQGRNWVGGGGADSGHGTVVEVSYDAGDVIQTFPWSNRVSVIQLSSCVVEREVTAGAEMEALDTSTGYEVP